MNSEELEQSLRTEFESYLKNVLADMRQEVSEFQKQFEAEFEKHKAQMDNVFQNFSTRIADDKQLEASFTESVVEHLRLSRDEGARITAMAIAEAEELEKQNAAALAETVEQPAPTVNFSEIRDAVSDISSKNTQSAILKTLVNHAAQFTSRGAFFIIKNEHLVGWRVFGKDGEGADEQTVREVFFPVASSTVLGEAVRSLSAVESSYGTYTDDSIYLNKLEFGQPEQMYAVPLVVRGRTVAVLYADNGLENSPVNIEALEMLVRVASLTVEILASSSRTAQTQTEAAEETSAGYASFEEPAEAKSFENRSEKTDSVEEQSSYNFAETESPVKETVEAEEEKSADATKTAETFEETYSFAPSVETDSADKPIEQPAAAFEETDYRAAVEGDSFSFQPSVEAESSETVKEVSDEEKEEFQTVSETEAETSSTAPAWSQTVETENYSSKDVKSSFETPSYQTESSSYQVSEPQTYETETPAAENEYAPSLSGSDYQFETNQTYESPQTYETPSYETPAYETESYAPVNGASYDSAATEEVQTESYAPAETPVEVEEVVKQPAKSRFSERNVDLPIEVSEDERRLHNDARRFARLLVSEIKLYNEQKVKEGREGNELYDKLREAIDRSREMYDKRVQPPVAAKFDYFHYELVSSLAEGDADKLGASYPGASV